MGQNQNHWGSSPESHMHLGFSDNTAAHLYGGGRLLQPRELLLLPCKLGCLPHSGTDGFFLSLLSKAYGQDSCYGPALLGSPHCSGVQLGQLERGGPCSEACCPSPRRNVLWKVSLWSLFERFMQIIKPKEGVIPEFSFQALMPKHNFSRY